MSIVTIAATLPVKYKDPTTCSFIWEHYATALDFGAMALLGGTAELYDGDEWSYPPLENTAGMHVFHCCSGTFFDTNSVDFGKLPYILHNIVQAAGISLEDWTESNMK